MKLILLLIVSMLSIPTFGQHTSDYEKAVVSFQKNFNAQHVDTIYNMYTPEMQESMTKEGVIRFVQGCYKQFGDLKSITLKKTENQIHSYTAIFDKATLLMELLLSDSGKILSLQFQEL
ncbi:DUF3887 domain-containing protein [Aquimarina sp. W85]|uniref:DUF3887 domain-containing protein n=1 Tax=Aquimarina rhodophyticola TaxID=3342246 RepID=UPI0036729BE1